MIKMTNVSKQYGDFKVLTECTTSVSKGEVIVVCGPSGSGKSTLIKCVNGLEPFQSGEITVNGISVGDPKTNLSKLRARVGMVFQNFELFPHMSITENLVIAQTKVLGRSKDEANEKGLKLLERVGLKAQASKFPGQLSGGQQQRVAVARALVGSPAVLLADEPTGNLDSKNGDAVMALMTELHQGGATIVMVTHDPRFARYADRTIHIFDGRIVEEGAMPDAAQIA
jgi:glutamate/aspartate transport system ATP-binding protein